MFRKYSMQCRCPVCHTVVALLFGRDLAFLEVLHASHAVDHFLRLLPQWIERAILLQVGLQRCFIRMRLELRIIFWTASMRV